MEIFCWLQMENFEATFFFLFFFLLLLLLFLGFGQVGKGDWGA